MEGNSDNNHILKLRVEDEDDLSVVSSLLQDALVAVEDMALLPASDANLHQQFVLITSRFCWEKSCQDTQSSLAAARTHTALIIDRVKSVQYKGIDRDDKNLILSLLAIAKDQENFVSIYFAGEGVLRIEIDHLSCVLHDMAEPWPTKFVPHHKIG
jgi:hypothetical protein